MLKNVENLLLTDKQVILDAEKLVTWKKSKNLYNFKQLPKTAILTVYSRKNSFISSFFRKPIKGVKGNHFLIENGTILLCTGCGYGAPYIVSLCEELRVLGVANFIFIGVAGCINQRYKEGDLLYVAKTFSGVGTSSYYSQGEIILPYSKKWNNQLQKNIQAHPVSCWSTDAPFRESLSLKSFYKEKGAQIVEMECAAIYAFANYYQLNTACFTIVSDQLTNEWIPPANPKKLVAIERAFIKNLLKML
ncbi:PNP_UDP_1 domain-containing protein [Tenacibaculum sp. 190524A02b]|uniref:Uridine phosphorylase n=1 Tax=Tenacibaculum vairaonense TaxID=3137860 RepID=A0ABP1FFN2_9FLAO